jgi:hypothetical protein
MSASHKSAVAIEDTRSFQRVKLFGNDSCYDAWDTNKDGSPKVYWQVCKH